MGDFSSSVLVLLLLECYTTLVGVVVVVVVVVGCRGDARLHHKRFDDDSDFSFLNDPSSLVPPGKVPGNVSWTFNSTSNF